WRRSRSASVGTVEGVLAAEGLEKLTAEKVVGVTGSRSGLEPRAAFNRKWPELLNAEAELLNGSPVLSPGERRERPPEPLEQRVSAAR
ncbi:MAG TPA: hypothetical protein VGK17_21895, partial [Propionicimonas sp.]